MCNNYYVSGNQSEIVQRVMMHVYNQTVSGLKDGAQRQMEQYGEGVLQMCLVLMIILVFAKVCLACLKGCFARLAGLVKKKKKRNQYISGQPVVVSSNV